MNETSDLTMWLAIQSFFLPVLVSFVQQPRWTPQVRTAVSVVIFGVAGALTTYFTAPDLFTSQTLITAVLASIVAGTTSYKAVWKPAGIRVLESATSPGDDTLEEEKAIADLVEAQALMTALGIDEDAEVVTVEDAGEAESTESRSLHIDLKQNTATVSDGNGNTHVHHMSEAESAAMNDLAPRKGDNPQA